MQTTTRAQTRPRRSADDFLVSLGAFALTARMKRLADAMVHDARALYRELGLEIEPNWYLLFLLLEHGRRASVSEIATTFGWSHPSVVALTGQMQNKGFVEVEGDPKDRRRTLLRLSKAGREQAKRARPIWEASRKGLESLVNETGVDVLAMLDALDEGLARRGYRERALDALDARPKRRR